MRKLLPILLALIGVLAGGGAGYFLRPPPADEISPATDAHAPPPEVHPTDHAAPEGDGHGEGATVEYVKLNNQFVVPVVEDARVASLVILSLSLEVGLGATERVYAVEPKLRDAFLQVLFDHANAGGFRGAFTDASQLDDLRRALLEAARKTLGAEAKSVLISDIVRQDNG
ncbi:flagellar basal body-associated protein FliL [Sedimentimonas flavescens]|uniref:flagellar basal body-associated FliL family protein n=1 Tax=Sedimentimonas flavescens TaxID=2851012 RepID=UPI001C4A3668|nr:flagellar basal body-associated FliL family protein [Sedimentimonas flavescens]MBW0158101.1 flagellar basal body-associated FliL family protein [Sedimentimonas flavescens]WBL33267.1 flagellar basal body-associated FliL family protein [Sinirhodobacter sp. HNIBRBA609]